MRMPPVDIHQTIDTIKHALRRPYSKHSPAALGAILQELHPSAIAFILDELDLPHALRAFEALPDEEAAEVLDEVSPTTNRYLISNSPRDRILRLLNILPMDDAAELLSEYGEEESQPLLATLAKSDSKQVHKLLAYPERTAGRLMTTRFARLSAKDTVSQALDYLKTNARELETINVVYVLGAREQFVGSCSIADLLTARPDIKVQSLISEQTPSVSLDTNQKDVAQLISQYDLLAIPVLEKSGRMMGIVTVDDVIDVLVEEFNEDIARIVGTDAEEMDQRTPAQVARMRLPWLLLTMLIELVAGLVVSRFDRVLRQVILLASFMPVISAISGNVGLQAAAIVVRGLDTGHISLVKWGRAVRKELSAAFLLALACGVSLGTVGGIWSHHAPFGVVVGVSMCCSMLTAGLMGTIFPMLSKRLGFDPAATAGPFETSFQDVVGFSVFLGLATLLVHWLK
ncbi:MAG: magnesium transporter [Armatimonadetes bacterium]|nr:magnesium transporter [Armatimonadota bacterium]